jgi:hypothetical protein
MGIDIYMAKPVCFNFTFNFFHLSVTLVIYMASFFLTKVGGL